MKKYFQFTTLHKNILFYFLITSILALLITFSVIYLQVSHNIKIQENNKLVTVRDLKMNRILNWLKERKGDILVIANDNQIREMEFFYTNPEIFFESGISIIENARQHLERYLHNFPDYQELLIIHPQNGRIIMSTIKEREQIDVSDRPYAQISHESETVSVQQIRYSEYLKNYTLDLSVPIYCLEHEGNHIVGILVARINPEISLYPLLSDNTGLGSTGETIILNQQQIVQNPLCWQNQAALHLKISSIAAINSSQGLSGEVEAVDYRGERVLTAYTFLPEFEWGLITKQDLKEVYDPLSRMVNRFLLLFIGISLVVYLVTRYLAKAITQPISEMGQVAVKIQQGDYSQKLDETGSDEISKLAETMNQMSQSIQHEINIRKARTKILENIIHSRNLLNFSQKIIFQLCQNTHSQVCVFYHHNKEQNLFEHLASVGMDKSRIQSFDINIREGMIGQVFNRRDIINLKDIPEDTRFVYKTMAGNMLPREMIGFPLILDDQIKGIIVLASIYPYSQESLEIIRQSKTQISIAMGNILADEETQRLNQLIKDKNENLTRLTVELQEQTEELKSQKEELQHQNIELELQKNEIQEANRLKGEFLSNMSHELRTPLNSIIALSDILELQLSDDISQEQRQYLKVIARNGKNLLNLINDILDLSKIEAGKISIYPELFSLKEIINNVKENFSYQAQEKGIELISELPEKLPKIFTDRQKLNQILQNLISNAVKFTEKGSVTLQVSFNKEDDRFLFRVVDTGIGISQKDLPVIFEEFKQIDGSASRKYEGTGLGLAIVSRLVNRLNGEIYVESNLGEGSTFTILLPREIQDHHTVELLNEKNYSPATNFSQKRKDCYHLLLVEDNPTAVSQIQYLLKQEGYQLTIARGGEEALNYIQESIPDGIILDLMMPEIDGFHVLQKIREDWRFRNIPVLVLTAKDLNEKELQILKYNHINQLILKGSLDRAGLLEKINLMLGDNTNLKEDNSQPKKNDKKKGTKEFLGNRKSEKNSNFQKKILIAEDNADNLLTIKAILKKHYQLSEANTGEEALQKVVTEKPDLILLDIGLPEIDGFQVIKKLKSNTETNSIPIIALTAMAMSEQKKKIMEEGSDDYLSKPVNASVLIDKINKWLDKKK